MKKKNVALFDSSYDEAKEFIEGLKKETKLDWEAIVCTSNKGRKGINNIIRYIKYFFFPFKIFLTRKKYNIIIGWQEFYGLLFAFYCDLFKVKKNNYLIIKNFIYKPKRGIIGKMYYKFMNKIVHSKYVDVFICASKTMIDYCSEVFNISKDKFCFLPFGVNDFSQKKSFTKEPTEDYFLSLGRSNRDWKLLINTFKGNNQKLIIICDELKYDEKDLTDNIIIKNDVWGDDTLEYIYNCKCMIIPIENGRIASGDTVLIQAMSFSKPIIITKPSCLADDYVEDGVNGLIVEKKCDSMNNAITRIINDTELCKELSKNSRNRYTTEHSLKKYGSRVGEIINKIV